MIPTESSGYATDVSLAEFCMEMFDGGKWQRQLYFNFVFGIEAQFLAWQNYWYACDFKIT